jgi:hypothetical protein
MMKNIRRFIRTLYQPFRTAVVKPIENSNVFEIFKKRALEPLKISSRRMVGRMLRKSKYFKPCVVVRLDCGLGNQMQQYSLGRKVEELCALQVYYDVTWFKRDGLDSDHKRGRNLGLETAFPSLKIPYAGYFTSRIYRHLFKLYPGDETDNEEFVVSSNIPRYLEGHCLRFRDDQKMRGVYVFGLPLSEENRKILSMIEKGSCSVAVHVRRGDYVGSRYEMATPGYFKEAIRIVAKNESSAEPVFFIFSDGMDWCREALAGIDAKIVFVECNDNDNGPADMYLMSRCSHFILSNSTFSYWSAFLSDRTPDKLVISPRRGFADNAVSDGKLSGWIGVSVDS